MIVVIDASVAVTALADDGSAGHELRTRLQADADLHVPELLDLEVAAVLRRLVVVERTLSARRASEALEDLADLPAERYGHRPLLRRVWELRHNVAIYDGWYVALAEALDLPLATLDGRLAKADGPKCRFLTPDSNK